MKRESKISKHLILEGKTVEAVLRRAVRSALLMHKRAGNSIASWDGERVVIVPADKIMVDDPLFVARRKKQEA